MKEYMFMAENSTTSLNEATTKASEQLNKLVAEGWIVSGDPQFNVSAAPGMSSNRSQRFSILQRLEREKQEEEKMLDRAVSAPAK